MSTISSGSTAGTRLRPIRFGEFLVERSVISEAQLLDALADHWARGCRFGDSLSRRGYLDAGDVERLAREFHDLAVVYI